MEPASRPANTENGHFQMDANPTTPISSACLTIKESQMEESSAKIQRFKTFSVESCKRDEETAACAKDEPPPRADATKSALFEYKFLDQFYSVSTSDLLIGNLGWYYVQKFVGQGGFGRVAQCLKLDIMKKVAVKIVRKDKYLLGKSEIAMLESLRELDHKKNNLVSFIEHFQHKDNLCLVFEMLDMNLDDFINRNSRSLPLSGIRVITEQILVALTALKSIGLVHADIKPDNIMFVNHKLQPFKVKLIDFGMAIPISKMSLGTQMQVLSYRAPEVLLGLSLNEAVDMWSLGCILAYLSLGKDLYPFDCGTEVMRFIIQMQDQPDYRLLFSGMYSGFFFSKNLASPSPSWELNTWCKLPCCKNNGSVTKKPMGIFDKFTSINDMVKICPEVNDNYEYEAFVSFLKQLLCVDPEIRITSSEALEHRFITSKYSPTDSDPDPHMSPAFSMLKRNQMETSSAKFNRFKTFSVENCQGPSITSLDDPVLADKETATCTKYEPPPKANLKEANTVCSTYGPSTTAERTTADTNKKPPATVDTITVSSDYSGNITTDGDVEGLVQVKTRKTFLKRARCFFSRLLKNMNCLCVDVAL